VRGDIFYHHILDTRTGYPVESEITSVTIVSPSGGIRGEGLTTAVFVLGALAGLDLVESLPDADAIVLMNNGAILTTTGVGSPEMGRPIVFRINEDVIRN
jgi:thiamine biosynthesis lipoprotein